MTAQFRKGQLVRIKNTKELCVVQKIYYAKRLNGYYYDVTNKSGGKSKYAYPETYLELEKEE